MTEPPLGEWLSVDDYATRMHVSQATVRSACKSGELLAQRVGRQFRVWYASPTAKPDGESEAAMRARIALLDKTVRDLQAELGPLKSRQLEFQHGVEQRAVCDFALAALQAGNAAVIEEMKSHAKPSETRPRRARALAVLAHVENTLKQYQLLTGSDE